MKHSTFVSTFSYFLDYTSRLDSSFLSGFSCVVTKPDGFLSILTLYLRRSDCASCSRAIASHHFHQGLYYAAFRTNMAISKRIFVRVSCSRVLLLQLTIPSCRSVAITIVIYGVVILLLQPVPCLWGCFCSSSCFVLVLFFLDSLWSASILYSSSQI